MILKCLYGDKQRELGVLEITDKHVGGIELNTLKDMFGEEEYQKAYEYFDKIKFEFLPIRLQEDIEDTSKMVVTYRAEKDEFLDKYMASYRKFSLAKLPEIEKQFRVEKMDEDVIRQEALKVQQLYDVFGKDDDNTETNTYEEKELKEGQIHLGYVNSTSTDEVFLTVGFNDCDYYFYAPEPNITHNIQFTQYLKNLPDFIKKIYEYGQRNIPLDMQITEENL